MQLSTLLVRSGCVGLFSMAALSPLAVAQTVALHSDFNHVTAGERPPNGSSNPLPGDPDGDYLLFSSQGGPITVESTFGTLDDKPLVMSRETIPASFFLRLETDPDLQDCDYYLVSWRSLLQSPFQYFFTCTLMGPPVGPSLPQMAVLIYQTGGELFMNGTQSALSVSSQPGVAQLFEVWLDITNQTTSLSIDGVPVPEAQDLPFFHSGSTGLRRFVFSAGGMTALQFAVDDIHAVCMVPEPAPMLAQLSALIAVWCLSRARRNHPGRRP